MRSFGKLPTFHLQLLLTLLHITRVFFYLTWLEYLELLD
jgi:hypothetical protein